MEDIKDGIFNSCTGGGKNEVSLPAVFVCFVPMVELTELLAENERCKKTMHPIERIARFHLEFEGIHPFIDGNGRTGRWIYLEVVKE